MTRKKLDLAVRDLIGIMQEEPPEPESSKREPERRQYNREYHQWQRDVEAWEERIADWQQAGFEVLRGPGANEIHARFYDEEIPQTRLKIRPDGSVEFRPWRQDPEDPPPYGWIEPLELLLPGQDPDKFQQKNEKRRDNCAKYSFKHLAANLLQNKIRELDPAGTTGYLWSVACVFQESARKAEAEYAALVREVLDPQRIRKLRKQAGQEVRSSLSNYNLAVLAGETLAGTARANPGALAWWFYCREGRNDIEERRQSSYHQPEQPKPGWLRIPEHPGEIIAEVRKGFEEAGGKRWRTFASQPASHIAKLLQKEGKEYTVRICDLLAEADLPKHPPAKEARIKTPPKPRKKPKTAQISMFPGLAEPEPEPATAPAPAPAQTAEPEPAEKRRKQPPVSVKMLMSRLMQRTCAPSEELDRQRRYLVGLDAKMPPWPRPERGHIEQALDKMAVLAFREYAGEQYPQSPEQQIKALSRKFNHIADYVFAEPEFAVRHTTWSGMSKAADDWHGEAQLRLERLKVEAQIAKYGENYNRNWEAALEEHRSPGKFQARLLRNPAELLEESWNLMHCVGNTSYVDLCRKGISRIYHLEPDENGLTPAEAAQRTTTVEFAAPPNQDRWEIRQHTGLQNRSATAQEQEWARDLLRAYQKAEDAAIILKTPKSGNTGTE